ncbi:MarR family winged helix-turn-helix transcriptional regulator [Clostridium thermobutyricum]|uniref:MarR family winged helix-turn-helix transcriptional regulator n=1 Tax=Clostridium thermobutyricum TaxID=29372 RepID=UPI003F51D39F
MSDIYEESFGNMVYKARVLMRLKLQKKLKDYDVTAEQWNVLSHIYSKEGFNQKELAERCLKDRAALTRILDLLEKKELIKRESSPIDRREYLVYLTEKGKSTYNEILPVINENTKENLANFSEEEIIDFKNLLNKLLNNLS